MKNKVFCAGAQVFAFFIKMLIKFIINLVEALIVSYSLSRLCHVKKQKLYFVLETKGTDNLFMLREEERLKIHCGAQHFKALDDINFSAQPVRDWKEFKQSV